MLESRRVRHVEEPGVGITRKVFNIKSPPSIKVKMIKREVKRLRTTENIRKLLLFYFGENKESILKKRLEGSINIFFFLLAIVYTVCNSSVPP